METKLIQNSNLQETKNKQKGTIEEIKKYKKQCQEIIQRLMEPAESTADLDRRLEDCAYLTQAHYDDLCEERSLADLCGYILCLEKLSEKNDFKDTQIYRIRQNKVYDITKRRMYCSDYCFTAATFLHDQMSTEIQPLRLSKIQLQTFASCGGIKAGDIVQLKPPPARVSDDAQETVKDRVEKKKIEPKGNIRAEVLRQEKQLQTKISSPYIEESTLQEIKKKFDELNIREKNLQNTDKDFEAFMDVLQNNYEPKEKQICPPLESSQDNHKDSEKPYDEANLGEIYENNVYQYPEDIQAEVDSFSVTTFSGISNISTISKARKYKKKRFFLDTISKLKQWSTKDTKELLKCVREDDDTDDNGDGNGEMYLKEFDFNRFFANQDPEERLARYRYEYLKLTAKLDMREAIEDRQFEELITEGLPTSAKTSDDTANDTPIDKNNAADSSEAASKLEKRSSIKKSKKKDTKKKKVRFDVEEGDCEVNCQDDGLEEEAGEKPKEPENGPVDEPPPLYFPEILQPEKQRIKQFLIEIEKVLFDIFNNYLDQFDLDRIRHQIKRLVRTFNFDHFPLLFDRKATFMIVIIILEALLKYSLLIQDNDHYFENETEKVKVQRHFRDKFSTNPIIETFMNKFNITQDIIDENLERIWPLNSQINYSDS